MRYKKIIVFILFQVLMTHFLIADTHIPPGDVSGVWTIEGSPYIIDGHISVPVDSILIIDPGVNIVFSGSYKFKIYGRLLSEGTEIDTIYFTAQDTTIGWKGLKFYDTDINQQDSSKVKYCRLEYGRQASLIYFSNSSCIIINNCVITNNLDGRGISCGNSSPTIVDVTISNNISQNYGGGISCTDYSNPSLFNVTVVGNSAMWGGGIACRFGSNPILEGVTIRNNTAQAGAGMFCAESSPILNNVLITENDGGGFCCTDESSPILTNVIINYNNNGIICFDSSPILTNIVINGNSGGGGAYFGGTDTVLVRNFEITGNSQDEDNIGGGVVVTGVKIIMVNGIIAGNYAFDAGGIYGEAVHLSLTNVTICDNTIDDWGYVGGIGLNYNCTLDMTNCILWNNELNEIVFMGPGCSWNITYCDIEDEISPGIGNISVDPQFADTLYHLSEDSPCIDAGNPDTMYYDPEDPNNPGYALYPAMGTLINDIGFYGGHGNYEPPYGVDDEPHFTDDIIKLSNFPNPFTNSTTISFSTTKPTRDTKITIYNIKGQKIKTLINNQIMKGGNHDIMWDGTNSRNKCVGSGIYFIKLRTEKCVNVKKIVKLDL